MSLISSIADFLKPTPTPTPKVRKALERVGEIVDPLLKSASGFERELAPPVEHVLGYCEGLIAALPGPIDINRQAFSGDPLVHAVSPPVAAMPATAAAPPRKARRDT